ncbi:MAG: hypothetical protein ACLVJ6_01305 [Merdibacter sp.]
MLNANAQTENWALGISGYPVFAHQSDRIWPITVRSMPPGSRSRKISPCIRKHL